MKKTLIGFLCSLFLFFGCASGNESRNLLHDNGFQLKHNMAKEGWTLLENVPFNGQPFDIVLVDILRSGEYSVKSKVMRLRAKELNAHLGQGHAEYLLRNQNKIPAEYRPSFLIFPGTVWRDDKGNDLVPYLGWDGDRWLMGFHYLMRDFHSFDRLIRLRE